MNADDVRTLANTLPMGIAEAAQETMRHGYGEWLIDFHGQEWRVAEESASHLGDGLMSIPIERTDDDGKVAEVVVVYARVVLGRRGS